MPKLISIAVESPKRYTAIDSEGQVWRGHVATRRGGPIVWEPINSEFPASGEAAKVWSGQNVDS